MGDEAGFLTTWICGWKSFPRQLLERKVSSGSVRLGNGGVILHKDIVI